MIDRFALGIPFIATLPSATDIFVTPLLQARIDGSPLVVKGRTKPFSESRESEIALTLDGLDVPQMASYAPASVPVAVKSGKLSTDLNVSFAISGDTPTIRIEGTADLADLAVTDKSNAPLVAARALHVKIANAEPLRDIYRLDEVTLSNPDVHLARDSSGQLNVQKLAGPAPKASAEPARTEAQKEAQRTQKEAPPLDLTIRHLAIDGGKIALDDQLLKEHVQGALTGLAVTLDDFSTLAKTPAKYTLKTAFDHGGALDASGKVTLAAKTADAKLALNAFALPPLQPYLANVLAARVTSGTLGANLPVSVDWGKPDGGVQVGAGDVKLDALTLVPNAGGGAPIKLASAVAKIAKVDVSARNAALDSVQLSGLALDATRRKDGTIDLAALAGPHEAAPEQTATHKIQKAQAAGPAWHYRIGEISLADTSANITDETTAQPVKLRVAPLAVNVKQFSDDLTKPLAVDGKLTLNGKGALAIGGNVTVTPLKLALHVKGDQVDASAFEPYFGDKLNIEVASAYLSANGDVAMSGSGKTLAASYKGDVSLSDVRMLDKATSDRFAGWKLLGLTNVKVNYSERGTDVDAARVTFAKFYGRVLLDAQGKLNLKSVVAGEGGPQSVTRGSTKEQGASAPAAASAATTVPVKTASNSGPPVNMRFGQLVLQDGRVTYTDNFIKPNYTANLVAINGTIGAFGTHSTTPAPVDVSAKLAANGPVSIKGQINPLIDKPALDLTASAHGVELTNLTPYSSKYAGYPITKGKLNVDLHYMLADNKLTANNHLVHRSVDVRRSHRQSDGDQAAGSASCVAVEELARRDRREYSDFRIAGQSGVFDRRARVAGDRESRAEGGDRAVHAARARVRRRQRRGSQLHRVRCGFGHVERCRAEEARYDCEGAGGQAVGAGGCDGPRRSEDGRAGVARRVARQPGQACEGARHVGQRRERGLERDQDIRCRLRQVSDEGVQVGGFQEADQLHRHDEVRARWRHEGGADEKRAGGRGRVARSGAASRAGGAGVFRREDRQPADFRRRAEDVGGRYQGQGRGFARGTRVEVSGVSRLDDLDEQRNAN